MEADIIIIGAGAAGLTAGIHAARGGGRVIILEKNASPGRKILTTGGGRCNLTHTGTIDEFVRAYGPCGRFVRPALHCLPPTETLIFFKKAGLPTHTDEQGRVYPANQSAGQVKSILVQTCEKARVEIRCNLPVLGIKKTPNGFSITTAKGNYHSRAVIICTGGMSWPKTGSTGDGYRFARDLGHSITPLRGGLGEVTLKENWPERLAGVTLDSICLHLKNGKKRLSFPGSMVFTHRGISGPAAMNLSREFNRDSAPGHAGVTLDFLPDWHHEKIRTWLLEKLQTQPGKEVAAILSELLPRSVSRQIVTECRNGEGKSVAGQLNRKTRTQILQRMKETTLTVKTAAPLEEATITLGGIDRADVDPKRMASKRVEGLFFAGEVLDADGPCGGYNLQIAWSTGTLAGQSAGKFLESSPDQSPGFSPPEETVTPA